MKTLSYFLTLILLLQLTAIQAQNPKQQKKYFPKVVKKMKVYLGSSEAYFLNRCADCEDQKNGESFRKIYQTTWDDKQFESAIFYISTKKAELYEMILIAKEGVDVNELANKLWGNPNHEDAEWRFSPEETGQAFTIACWTYKNKLIIAGDLKGSEWEPGF